MDQALERVSGAVLKAFWENSSAHSSDRPHYMDAWRDPYLARRRKVGWDLYALMGIKKGEREKTQKFHAENYRFFGAPVGLLFTIDKDMGWMSWLDYGMFIQNICIAARGQGLHTCPQASWGHYHEVLAEELALEEPEIVHVGMSLGYEDTEAPQNKLETVREPAEDFAVFHS
jgi:nitroreductase